MMSMPISDVPLIAVVSPKGGNGKTTIAVNLAVALAKRTPSVLVDFDIHFGDVEYALGIKPLYRLDSAIAELNGNFSIHPEEYLEKLETGVEVLCAPSDPLIADRLDSRDCFAVIDTLRSLNKPLVMDTEAGLSEYNIGAIERSTHTILVSSTDVASVQAAKKLLSTMSQFGLNAEKVQLVVNRSDAHTGLELEDVEEALGRKAIFGIPESVNIACSSNQGRPIAHFQQGSSIAKLFYSYISELLGDPSRQTPHRRFLHWSNS